MSIHKARQQEIAERCHHLQQKPAILDEDREEILNLMNAFGDQQTLMSYHKHILLLILTVHHINPFWKNAYKDDDTFHENLKAVITIVRQGCIDQNDVSQLGRLETKLYNTRPYHLFGWIAFLAVHHLNGIIRLFARNNRVNSKELTKEALAVIHFSALAYATYQEDILSPTNNKDNYTDFLRFWLAHMIPAVVTGLPATDDNA